MLRINPSGKVAAGSWNPASLEKEVTNTYQLGNGLLEMSILFIQILQIL
jgi:hypothetical protein